MNVVALDGPAGSGKSTVARLTAEALNWAFVDTGATYRAVTLAVLRSGIDLDDHDGVTAAAQAADISLITDPAAPAVFLDGEDVTAEVRAGMVTAAVSAVSAIPGVRQVMIDLQRTAMGRNGAVVEGRDIATVVAPRARVKVYLDADETVRARRRSGDRHVGLIGAVEASPPLGGDGKDAQVGVGTLAARVQIDLARRDAVDSKTNALTPSEGAVHLDTSDMTLQEVVAAVVALVQESHAPDEGQQ